MGIYPSGIIYGIRIYKVVNDKAINIFEKKYDNEMSYEERRQIRFFYKALTETEKHDLRFQIYTECSASCEDDFMLWYPISLEVFRESFYC